mgnify:CR=1 FL=1
MHLQKEIFTKNFAETGDNSISGFGGFRIITAFYNDPVSGADQKIIVRLGSDYTKKIVYADTDVDKNHRCLLIQTFTEDEQSTEILKKVIVIQEGKKITVYTYFSTNLVINI